MAIDDQHSPCCAESGHYQQTGLKQLPPRVQYPVLSLRLIPAYIFLEFYPTLKYFISILY